VADIIGALRAWTVAMISSVSMPWRWTLVVPRLACPSWRWITFERHAFAREFDGVGMAQLVWREAATHAGLDGEAAKLDADRGARPRPPACRAVDHAEQRPDRQLHPLPKPGRELFPAPRVHADLPAAAALAAAYQQRAAPWVKVLLSKRQRVLHAQSAAPEHRDQRPDSCAVAIVTGVAHHGDDLLDGRRVRRVLLPLVARRTTSVIARERCRRAAPAGCVEHWRSGHGILLPIARRMEHAALAA